MEAMKHELPPYHPIDDGYSSFSSDDSGIAFASSLRCIDTPPLATDGQRRQSFTSIESSVTPELLSTSSVGTVSPSTPLNDCSFSSNFMDAFRNMAPQVNLQAMWNTQHGDFAEHDFGYSPAALKERGILKYFNSYSTDIHDASASFYTPSAHGFSNDDTSPALSRPMFHETIQSSTAHTMNNNTHWPSVKVAHTPPRTIDPSTFGPFVLNTPAVKATTPCTPSRQYSRSSVILSSSPMLDYSPSMVPSQHEVDDSAYFSTSSFQDAVDLTYERLHLEEHHRNQSRLSRRRYDRKGSGSGCKRRPLATKSGFECDRVITANSFACSYPECIDKNTGKQKRFKRQEHKKRHEKTVHQKESQSSHKCWVPQCERSFSRTDNLKSHLKNTHGKRSPNARNRYVATLDPNNLQYYCPDWEGDLTTEGLPVG